MADYFRVMAIGFSGSREGMTVSQYSAVLDLLEGFGGEALVKDLHHGGCIGADTEAHEIAIRGGWNVVVHWGHQPNMRGKLKGLFKEEKAMNNLERNLRIAECAADGLIAAPGRENECVPSGTWATVRHARRLGRKIWLVMPDGVVKIEAGRAREGA